MREVKKYPWFVRLLFYFQKRKYGHVLNSALIWAKVPRIFLALSWFYGAIDNKKSLISSTLRTLLIVRVSQLNGCDFCIDLNTATLIEQGVDIAKIKALCQWQESDLFSDQERIALAYAEEVTNAKQKINETISTKIDEWFNEKAKVELTAIIAFQDMSTKFNNAFGVESQGFCTLHLKSETTTGE